MVPPDQAVGFEDDRQPPPVGHALSLPPLRSRVLREAQLLRKLLNQIPVDLVHGLVPFSADNLTKCLPGQ